MPVETLSKFTRGYAAMLGLTALVSGCAYFPLAKSPRQAAQMPHDLEREFSYQRNSSGAHSESIKSSEKLYDIRRVALPISVVRKSTSPAIGFDYYLPHAGEKFPVIIILAISGGGYALEQNFASYFAELGYAAIVVDREHELDQDAGGGRGVDLAMRQGVITNRQIVDWIETRKELDTSRIGVLGTSTGAIKGAMLAATESRISASVLLLVGGDLPHILMHSDLPKIVKKREQYLSDSTLSQAELEALLRQNVSLDPLRLAPFIDPSKVMLVLAGLDTTVPFSTGWQLRGAMGEPQTVVLFGNHYTALLYLLSVREFAREFFESNLSPKR
jgi:hypothetical protein